MPTSLLKVVWSDGRHVILGVAFTSMVSTGTSFAVDSTLHALVVTSDVLDMNPQGGWC